MIPGSHPMQVKNDDKEQTNEATARREVRWAVVPLWPVQGGGMAGWLEISGTVILALQSGQAIDVPAWAVSEETFRPQAGHEKLNSLMAGPVDLTRQRILREI